MKGIISLENKHIVVTGAASGIGAETATALATKAGAPIFLRKKP